MQLIYYSDSLAHHGVKGMKWGVRRYQKESKKLYKSLIRDKETGKRDTIGEQEEYYKHNKLIKQMIKDPRWKQIHGELTKVGYDGPEEEYNPFDDPEVIKKAQKDFKKDLGRAYNPESYQDEKLLGYYMDDIVDKGGYREKEKKLNASPNWDKAYDNYTKQRKEIIKDYLGKYANQKIKSKTFDKYAENYADAVDNIIFSWTIET